jgi:serine/threonine-protein kinase RsbW
MILSQCNSLEVDVTEDAMPDQPAETGQKLTRCDFNSSDLLVKLDLTLAGDVNAISPVVEKAMEVVTAMGCAAGKEFEIELALREALANAVEHGSGHDPAKEIQCCVACDHTRGMLIVVRDPGPGFDPAQIPSPVLGVNLFSTGGRGIYLINQLMDEVRFERGGTEIHMVARTGGEADDRPRPATH